MHRTEQHAVPAVRRANTIGQAARLPAVPGSPGAARHMGAQPYPSPTIPYGLHLLVGLQEDGVAVQEARAGLVGGRRRAQPRVGRQDGLGEPARARRRRQLRKVTPSRLQRRRHRSATPPRHRHRRRRNATPLHPHVARPRSVSTSATPATAPARLCAFHHELRLTGNAPNGLRGALARPRVHRLRGPVEAAVAARRERQHEHARGWRLLAHAPRGQQHARRNVRAHGFVVVQVLPRAPALGSWDWVRATLTWLAICARCGGCGGCGNGAFSRIFRPCRFP